MIDFTLAKFGRIDQLVLAAGISAHSKFSDIKDIDVIRKVMDVNIFSHVNMTRHALPYLRISKGKILVISSFSSLNFGTYR